MERTPGGHSPHLPPGFSRQLDTIATAWSTADPTLLTVGNAGSEFPAADKVLSSGFKALQDRVFREILSRSWHLPELLKLPLADQPMNTALDTLVQYLAAAREWRRLLFLLEQRSAAPLNREGEPAPAAASIRAIRFFLTGQNFEMAEQWGDAVLAYKAVLSTSAEIGPIADAAERLKTLAKEHPQNSKSPLAARKLPRS